MISVIVPIYNLQSYIERCITSVINQTYTDFELIIVDDGSTDKSAILCEHYATTDARIKNVYIQHSGPSAARNVGLEHMSGEWFCFVDGDDWVEPEYLETLYQNAVEYNADLVACGFRRNYEVRKWRNSDCGIDKLIILNSADECRINLLSDHNSMEGMVWNKLYRREKFGNLRFEANRLINEDCLYSIDVTGYCTRAILIPNILYHWTQRTKSLSHSRCRVKNFESAEVFLSLIELSKKLSCREVEMCLMRHYFVNVTDKISRNKLQMSKNRACEAFTRCKHFFPYIRDRLTLHEKIKFYVANMVFAQRNLLGFWSDDDGEK